MRDLDQDIWQIIFKLNVFQPTLVRFRLSLAEAAPEGGASPGSHCNLRFSDEWNKVRQ